jgi:hypothetical protein
MEKIMIEVDKVSEKAYNKMSPEAKQQFSLAINLLLKKAINKNNYQEYLIFLDEIGEEANKNGLTEAKLQELLQDHG